MSSINLKYLNYSMSILHLAMAIFLTVYYYTEDYYDKYRQLYRYGYDRTPPNSQNISTLQINLEEDGKFFMSRETISFFYITAIFHLIYAMDLKGMYTQMINNKNNYLRWIEYSITATLMIRIIAVQAGVRDNKTLGLLTANTIGIMLQGWIVEIILKRIQSTGDGKVKKNLWISAMIATVVGWLLVVVNFVIIFMSFGEQVQSVDNLDCESKVPEWVWAIVITQAIFYLSFGGIQLYHMWSVSKNMSNYKTIETAYIFDSLVSKFTLGGLLAYSVISSGEGEESELEGCN